MPLCFQHAEESLYHHTSANALDSRLSAHNIMDVSDYTLTAILSMVSLTDNEVQPIAFHSCTFTPLELNYNVHNKELLAIFKAFKIWHHYLEGSLTLIDVVTDHKNLEYFSTTKLFTHCQVHWSEFLCQFNLTIYFHPGCLGTKPNALMR